MSLVWIQRVSLTLVFFSTAVMSQSRDKVDPQSQNQSVSCGVQLSDAEKLTELWIQDSMKLPRNVRGSNQTRRFPSALETTLQWPESPRRLPVSQIKAGLRETFVQNFNYAPRGKKYRTFPWFGHQNPIKLRPELGGDFADLFKAADLNRLRQSQVLDRWIKATFYLGFIEGLKILYRNDDFLNLQFFSERMIRALGAQDYETYNRLQLEFKKHLENLKKNQLLAMPDYSLYQRLDQRPNPKADWPEGGRPAPLADLVAKSLSLFNHLFVVEVDPTLDAVHVQFKLERFIYTALLKGMEFGARSPVDKMTDGDGRSDSPSWNVLYTTIEPIRFPVNRMGVGLSLRSARITYQLLAHTWRIE
jgi:hypothetical protein